MALQRTLETSFPGHILFLILNLPADRTLALLEQASLPHPVVFHWTMSTLLLESPSIEQDCQGPLLCHISKQFHYTGFLLTHKTDSQSGIEIEPWGYTTSISFSSNNHPSHLLIAFRLHQYSLCYLEKQFMMSCLVTNKDGWDKGQFIKRADKFAGALGFWPWTLHSVDDKWW